MKEKIVRSNLEAIASGEAAVQGTVESNNPNNGTKKFASSEKEETKVFSLMFQSPSIPIAQMCKDDCPFIHDEVCPIDMVSALDRLGALWGEMELLQYYSTYKVKCPTADAMISDFLNEDIYTGEELGARQFAYALIVLGFGAPLDAVKGWLREAVKNGNKDAKELLRKLR